MSAFVLSTKSLPEERFMPEIGNGHIATAMFNPYVHMNGVYNGEGSSSSRAKIPSLVAFKTAIDGMTLDETYSLNLKEGIFTETKVNPAFTLTRETFVHRGQSSLLLSSLNVTSLPSGQITLSLDNIPPTNPLVSPDIDFSPTEHRAIPGSPGDQCSVATGLTRSPEVAGQPRSTVTVAWYSTVPLNEKLVVGKDGLNLQLFVSINSSEQDAVKALVDAIQCGFPSLRASHIARWDRYWSDGRIDVDPGENLHLAQTLYSTLYFLLSSLPNSDNANENFIGLSPGGLAHGAAGAEIDQDYLGHSFWDTEMWMFPPILFFHPDLARVLIQARLRTLEQAKINAQLVRKEGAKFPWESAVTGIETTPWKPAADFEIHVTGDIAYAVRQFLYASRDKCGLIRDLALDRLVEEIAAWWQSCVHYESDQSCSVNDVMGPDEYHYPINNSAFTNCITKMSLELPSYVLSLIGKHDSRTALWSDTSAKIPIRTALTAKGQEYHPEFDAYSPDPDRCAVNPTVKQADVILLGYPLDMAMDAEIRANDLDIYRQLTDPRGPAMTWSMFAVGYLELKRKDHADDLFIRYTENSQPPFGVWSEVSGGDGAVNFLTGMGGFLQVRLA